MEEEKWTDKLKRKTKRFFRNLIIIATLVIVAIVAYGTFGVYDEGVRAGMVLRLSKKGILFKTYEGQLNLQTFGALKGASPITESFDFSVDSDNQEIIKQLEQAALSGERINLHYIKRYWIFPWRGDTKYFVTKVERLEKPTN